MNITAKITGTGPDSCVPDNAGATDANVYADGKLIGSVTLLPVDDSGDLDVWGGTEHWADGDLLALVEDECGDIDDALVFDIVEAVNAAREPFALGDRVLLDPVDYPRKKGEVGTITRPHPRGVSGRWGVEFNGQLHPYPVREESMTRT